MTDHDSLLLGCGQQGRSYQRLAYYHRLCPGGVVHLDYYHHYYHWLMVERRMKKVLVAVRS